MKNLSDLTVNDRLKIIRQINSMMVDLNDLSGVPFGENAASSILSDLIGKIESEFQISKSDVEKMIELYKDPFSLAEPIAMAFIEKVMVCFPNGSTFGQPEVHVDNGEVSIGTFRVNLDDYYTYRRPPFIELALRRPLDKNLAAGQKSRSYVCCCVSVPTKEFNLGEIHDVKNRTAQIIGRFTLAKNEGDKYVFILLVEISRIDEVFTVAREVNLNKDLTILIVSRKGNIREMLNN